MGLAMSRGVAMTEAEEALLKAQMASDDRAVTVARDGDGRAFGIVMATLVEDEDSPTGWAYDCYGFAIEPDGLPVEADGGRYWGYGAPDKRGLVLDALDVVPEGRVSLSLGPATLATWDAVAACAAAGVWVGL